MDQVGSAVGSVGIVSNVFDGAVAGFVALACVAALIYIQLSDDVENKKEARIIVGVIMTCSCLFLFWSIFMHKAMKNNKALATGYGGLQIIDAFTE